MNVRKFTCRLEDLISEGILTHKAVFEELMCFLSEAQVRDFCLNGFAGELSEEFKDLEVKV